MANRQAHLTTLSVFISTLVVLSPPLISAGKREPGKRRDQVIKVFKQRVKPAVVFIEGTRKKPKKYQDHTRLGLGVIVNTKGSVVLPPRVVDEAGKITLLILSDGRKFTPKAILSDPNTKVAVIKLESDKPLPHVPFGDSDTVKEGDWVFSLDWPWRERQVSVDRGIMAVKHRAGNKDEELLFVDSSRSFPSQRDLLFNLDGKLIGVWKSRAAVPSNRVKQAVDRLLKKK
jgi:S1-C subfamily serine protease